MNFVNQSFGSKVIHFWSILSLKWPKSEVFGHYAKNAVNKWEKYCFFTSEEEVEVETELKCAKFSYFVGQDEDKS